MLRQRRDGKLESDIDEGEFHRVTVPADEKGADPMAIAIMGGLTIATLLTIFFVPALYAAWFKVASESAQQATEVAADPALAC